MNSFVKWLLISLCCIFLVVADFSLVSYKQWPTWALLPVLAGFVITLSVILLCIWLLPKLIHKVKKWKLQQQIIIDNNNDTFARVHRLNSFWKQTADQFTKLRLSHKFSSNPLFNKPLFTNHLFDKQSISDLPWFLLIGASGSGKTRAIQNSGVASYHKTNIDKRIAADLPQWWLLDDAVVLDTPGHYVTQRDKTDTAEWKKFLFLLKKSRVNFRNNFSFKTGTFNNAPLSGIVACISAEVLLTGTIEELKKEAIDLHQCLYETNQVLGVSCPVYLLVTKCDVIDGLVNYFNNFPEGSVSQAMGGLYRQEPCNQQSVDAFAIKTVQDIYKSLAKLRLLILDKNNREDVHPAVILFPEEFLNISQSIQTWVNCLFKKSVSEERLIHRGLYFCSSEQTRVASPVLTSKIDVRGSRSSLPAGNFSFFLKDFFSKTLLFDKYPVKPTVLSMRSRQLKRVLMVSSVLAGSLFFGALLSMSFSNSLNALQNSFSIIPSSVSIKNKLFSDISMLDKFREAIVSLDDELEASWVPMLGLQQANNMSENLKTVYSGRFKNSVIKSIDEYIDVSLRQISRNPLSVNIVNHVDFLSNRVKVLRQSLDSTISYVTQDNPISGPDFNFVLDIPDVAIQKELSSKLSQTFYAYVMWQRDYTILQDELTIDLNRINNIINTDGVGLNWLVDWVNLQTDLLTVEASDYWSANVASNYKKNRNSIKYESNGIRINRAYTPEGWKIINDFLNNIELSIIDKSEFIRIKDIFINKYRHTYFNQWQVFLKKYSIHVMDEKNREQRLEFVSTIESETSSYRRIIHAAAAGLMPAILLSQKERDVPAWVNLIYRYNKLMDKNYQNKLKDKSLIGKIAINGGNYLSRINASLNTSHDTSINTDESYISEFIEDKQAIVYYDAYMTSLLEMVKRTESPKTAYILAKNIFQQNTETGESSSALLKNNIIAQNNLKKILGTGTRSENVFWNILSSQTKSTWHVVLSEAQSYIQETWDNEVLAAATGQSGWNMIETLQGENGAIWKYKADSIAPFLQNDLAKGYRSRVIYDGEISFNRNFLSLLNAGKVTKNRTKRSHRVLIAALPTGVNRNAYVIPHETHLIVQCENGIQELRNHNYSVNFVINWTSQECGNVTVNISVGNLVLNKKYSGDNAFIKFLTDFKSGKKIFYKNDFPGQQEILSNYNIDFITVSYHFSGHKDILNFKESVPVKIPARIVDGVTI